MRSSHSTSAVLLLFVCFSGGFAGLAAAQGASAADQAGQALQSFEDLALRVNLDDQVQVEDPSGARATGRLARLTRDEMAIQTDAGEKRFTSETVRAVAVRGHALRKGALIGAGVFAVLGAVACWGRNHETSVNCASWPLLDAVLIGAPLGLVVGEFIPQMRTIYRAPESRASVPRSRDAIGVQASLLEDLALRVNLDDQLRVEDQSGVRTTGRLTRLTANDMTIQTAAGEQHFTRETIRQVAVRRQPLRMATLIGAGAGAAIGAVAACTDREREECADAPLMAGAFGAGLGLAVGALMRQTTIVYPEPEKRTFIVPAISRSAVGVRVSRRW